LTDLRTAPDVSGGVIISIKKENILYGLLQLILAEGSSWFFHRLKPDGYFFQVHSLSKECTPTEISRFIMDFL
jgi:hypothetical protein